ncbi:hypothetical protein QF031_000812 [Pseudarthrobacter defluvii]|uniref:hypothetical protein n=1 Tax=Pseudarthrobacter defluvii TaxID=410837 RepID=UPI002787AE28|nr:hypothetical protein [Pseudarthrobacter defluvii]MDQ0768063.1 hypothetical protein [Pseudarthrobacter defluvii]
MAPAVTQQAAPPLTLFWKLVITLAAVVGMGTCAGLWALYDHFLAVHPGSVAVLQQPAAERDAVRLQRITPGEADIDKARFLATYDTTTFYATPGESPEDYCVVVKPTYDSRWYWESCGTMFDGRDQLAAATDQQGRYAILVPDQFDHKSWEAEGWVTVHPNLLIQPLASCHAPLRC